ncbi:MAG: hypothetical protein PHG66_04355 [Candidatus Colwellbacteria bacterium]|nr:hypothetical protein [Candidatus Colwellbacteria bacterium]
MALDLQSLNTDLPSGGYRETYSVSIEGGEHRTVTIIFDSEVHSEESEVDQYDDCREKIVQWLATHFPGEVLATDGNDIERSGYPADNDEVIDMRTTPLVENTDSDDSEEENERIGQEAELIKKELEIALDELDEVEEYTIEENDTMLFLRVFLDDGNIYDFWWDGDLMEEGENDGKWDYKNLEFINIAARLDKKYGEWGSHNRL